MMSLTRGMLMQSIVKRVLLDNAVRDAILGLLRKSNPDIQGGKRSTS